MKAENIRSLVNKNLAFIGLGAENLSFIKFLLKNKVACRITVCDPKTAAELGDRFLEIKQLARKNKMPEIAMMTGKGYDSRLTDFDAVFRSPGYPLFSANLIKAKRAGVDVDSPMRAFFRFCPTKNIIGVTGSKGKGTTSSLIYAVLKAAKKDVYLGGNIGIAPFDFFDKLKASSFVVLELSSFQLEDLDVSPRIAVITNVYKEHLAPADPANPNYHKTMKAYWEAKANIFRHQGKDGWLVINAKLSERDFSGSGNKIVYFNKSESPSNLTGEHNKENVAAAETVADILKIKKGVVALAIKKFKGLPHRLEFVAKKSGISYYDDSFATVPDVSVIALESFSGPVVLLAGGADKGSGFKDFAEEIKRRVKYSILFKGKGTDRLKKELRDAGYPTKSIKEVGNMKDAMVLAKKVAKPGDTVLLSTGCASFGCFKNYKERGDQFKKEVGVK